MKEKPSWLETLWNINPSLAQRAEDYISNLEIESYGKGIYDALDITRDTSDDK
jgi:hypothetical protein